VGVVGRRAPVGVVGRRAPVGVIGSIQGTSLATVIEYREVTIYS